MKTFTTVFFTHTFLINAVIVALLASVACGITGTFVVVKRITYLGGGIAHTVVGGLGIAYFLGINPIYGALMFAVAAAILIGEVKLRLRQHEDTAIGALWSVGMAVGIIFAALTPGYKVDLLSFLFGNILMVTSDSLWILAVLDMLIILTVFVLFRQFIAICFDEEHAALRGIPVEILYLLLLCLVAFTVVILIQIVGLILVIALLTLPAAAAGVFARSTGGMMILAVLLSMAVSLAGIAISFALNLPTGATIVLMAGIVYFAAMSLRLFIGHN
jgi:zinc transport system permease protein